MAEEVGPLRTEEGWQGFFTREEAPGAYENGTRIEKTNSAPGDGHHDGETGTVLGSLSAQDAVNELGAQPKDSDLAYFIEWDDMPRMAVGIGSARIKALSWRSKTQ